MKYAPNDTSLCSGTHADVRDVTRSRRPVTAEPSRCTGYFTGTPGTVGTVVSARPVRSSTYSARTVIGSPERGRSTRCSRVEAVVDVAVVIDAEGSAAHPPLRPRLTLPAGSSG